MTPARRRLVALAAALAPGRAASLLRWLGDEDGPEAALQAAALAAAPRATRLATLADALPEGRACPLGLHPLLSRLQAEARHRPADPEAAPPAARTLVRPAAGAARHAPSIPE